MTDVHTPVTLAGTPTVLLSHMALLGTAMIIDDTLGTGTARLRWTDGADPCPQLGGRGVTSELIGDVVRAHARRHVEDPESLLHAVDPEVGSLFSARTKSPSDLQGWRRLLEERDRVARGLRGLDEALVLGLGERAWWHLSDKTLRPDHGASAWEMRTRNKGVEFIAHSLLPVGEPVAARDAQDVLSGLTGETLVDEPGKGKADSRTATGLAPLGPADSARVWAGLWAIAAVPVWAAVRGRSVSSAALPAAGDRLARLLMPMPTSWVTAPRLQAALRSKVLIDFGRHADGEATRGAGVAAKNVLADWGFTTVLRFPVSVSRSTFAPERRALGGQVLG